MSEVNANYHRFTKSSVLNKEMSDRFKEYRRRWHVYPVDKIVGDFPIHIDIESTYRCNLECPYCARTSEHWGVPKKKDMDFFTYQNIIDEGVINNLYSIKLSLRGEPLLHKRLPEMILYAKLNGILDIYFNTNGVLLNERIINKLIDSKLDRISVSVDGIDKLQFEKDRYPAKYDDIVEKVKLIKEIRESREVDYPKIRVQTILNDCNIKTLNEYTSFWKEIADEVAGIDMRKEGKEWSFNTIHSKWCCPFIWQRIVVLCDGTIVPCLSHGLKDITKYSLGNVKETTIKDAWDGYVMNLMRDTNRKGYGHLLSNCDKCSYRAKELEKLGYDTCNINR